METIEEINKEYEDALLQLQNTVMIMNNDDYLPNNVDGVNEGSVTVYNNSWNCPIIRY